MKQTASTTADANKGNRPFFGRAPQATPFFEPAIQSREEALQRREQEPAGQGLQAPIHSLSTTTAGPFIQRKRLDQIKYPKLALYQADDPAAGFFRSLARRKAREISAISISPTGSTCPRDATFGASPYQTGAEIIEIIAKAYWCTGKQVLEIHIISHGNDNVIAATDDPGRRGIYSETLTSEEREAGGRSIGDIPTEALAPNVRWILHGCSIGAGDNSLAEALIRHIMGTSPRGRVYAHSESGTCGRHRDWRLFSRRRPDGRRVSNNPYHPAPETEE